MKNVIKIIFVFLFTLSSFLVFSQNSLNDTPEEVSLFEFQLKAALSLPSYFWLEDSSWNRVTMFTLQGAAWGCIAINISDNIAIQLEAGYNGKGASLDASDGSLKWKFHYLEIPAWVKKNYTAGKGNFWLGAGGYYGYFLGGTYKFSVPGSEWIGSGDMTVGEEEKITEARRHDLGLIFSVGYKGGKLLYEIRFPVSLIPSLAFTPEDTNTYGGYRKALNSGIMLSVGYSF